MALLGVTVLGERWREMPGAESKGQISLWSSHQAPRDEKGKGTAAHSVATFSRISSQLDGF